MIEPEMPARIAALPRTTDRGYPIPWFVAIIDGKPDFRVMDAVAFKRAMAERRCWICGQRMKGATAAFVIGPMCAVNHVSAEPPSHRECAIYAAQACPFLTNPKKVRREGHKPEGAVEPAGEMIKRNPGIALVWITRHWKPWDAGNGILFDIGKPVRCLWFAEGREATRAEVLASIESGLPALQDVADEEGSGAPEALARQLSAAMELVPV